MKKIVTIDGLNRYKDNAEIQVDTMPTAAAGLLGRILQYTGTTTATYTNGYFYKCVPGSTSGTYVWEALSVQAGGSAGRKPFVVTGTLSANGWINSGISISGQTYKYSENSVSNANILATDIPVADMDLSITQTESAREQITEQWGLIADVESSAGSVTFKCFGDTSTITVPTVDIPVTILLVPTV